MSDEIRRAVNERYLQETNAAIQRRDNALNPGVNTYAETLEDLDVGAPRTITHNLGTEDVVVAVYGDMGELLEAFTLFIVVTGPNTITVQLATEFVQAPLRIVVMG